MVAFYGVKSIERVPDTVGYALDAFCGNNFFGSVHHQFAAGAAERRFELAGVEARLPEVGTVQHHMVFAGVITAVLGVHLFAFGIENAEGYFGESREAEPQECHFDERIG